MTNQQLQSLLTLASLLVPQDGSTPTPTGMPSHIGQHVLVRTYSAGVHFGILTAKNGKEVTLTSARRIWKWFGANTLNEIATSGLDVHASRVSCPVASIDLTEAIEIIPTTDTARKCLESATWTV